MAKRARASRSSHRPGGQGPERSPRAGHAPSSAAPPTPEPDLEADIDAAVEFIGSQYPEASMVGAAAVAQPKPSRRARRSARSRPDDLAARAAAEDVWVRADLRRIGIISAVLLAGLAVAWVIFVLLDVLGLY